MKTIEIMQLFSIVAMSAFLLGHMVFMISKSFKFLIKDEGSLLWIILHCDMHPNCDGYGGHYWKDYEIFKNKNPFSFLGDGLFYTEKQKKINLRIYFILGFILIALLSASSLWYLLLGFFLVFPIVTLGIIQILGVVLEMLAFLFFSFFKYIPKLFICLCR